MSNRWRETAALGIKTLPVLYGMHGALTIAYLFIDVAQVFFAVFLFSTGRGWLGWLAGGGLVNPVLCPTRLVAKIHPSPIQDLPFDWQSLDCPDFDFGGP